MCKNFDIDIATSGAYDYGVRTANEVFESLKVLLIQKIIYAINRSTTQELQEKNEWRIFHTSKFWYSWLQQK